MVQLSLKIQHPSNVICHRHVVDALLGVQLPEVVMDIDLLCYSCNTKSTPVLLQLW